MLDFHDKFFFPSTRVKSLDLHPTEQWILASLYSGSVIIYSLAEHSIYRQLAASCCPVRAARFIASRNWIALGSDDGLVYVYVIDTLDQVTAFEAHAAGIRAMVVHPTRPLFLTASDDTTVKAWSFDFELIRVFEAHTHYIMSIAIRDRDPTMFATASLDGTARIWNLDNANASFALPCHPPGADAVAFDPHASRPYLATAGDDHLVIVWDILTKAYVSTLEGHTANVTALIYDPASQGRLFSASEDGNVFVWSASTFQHLRSFRRGAGDRFWSLAITERVLGIATDHGTVIVNLSTAAPTADMDRNTGRILVVAPDDDRVELLETLDVWTPPPSDMRGATDPQAADPAGARPSAQTTSPPPGPHSRDPFVPAFTLSALPQHGSPQSLSLDFRPVQVLFNAQGRLAAFVGEQDYAIVTVINMQTLRFGKAFGFAWAPANLRGCPPNYRPNHATLSNEGRSAKIQVMDREGNVLAAAPLAHRQKNLYGGGPVLAVESCDAALQLYSWHALHQPVLSLPDVKVRVFAWNGANTRLAIAVSKQVVVLEMGAASSEQLMARIATIGEPCTSATWSHDALFLITKHHMLLQVVIPSHGQAPPFTAVLARLDGPAIALGYLARAEQLVFYLTESRRPLGLKLPERLFAFYESIVSGDGQQASDSVLASLLDGASVEVLDMASRLAEHVHRLDLAQRLSMDPDQQFRLAIQAGDLDAAEKRVAGSRAKLATLAEAAAASKHPRGVDVAISAGKLPLALILARVSGDPDRMQQVRRAAISAGDLGTAFLAAWVAQDHQACAGFLEDAGFAGLAGCHLKTYVGDGAAPPNAA